MVWIFAIVVLLLFVFVRGFRNFALILIAGIVVLVLIENSDSEKKKKDREAAEAQRAATWGAQQAELEKSKSIPLSDVTLSDLAYSRENGGRLSGRVHNKSKAQELNRLSLRLTINDCGNADGANCEVVGEQDVNLNVSVPTGQARDFDESLHFYQHPIVIRGHMEFKTALTKASQ